MFYKNKTKDFVLDYSQICFNGHQPFTAMTVLCDQSVSGICNTF
jgi:hypothetical protein